MAQFYDNVSDGLASMLFEYLASEGAQMNGVGVAHMSDRIKQYLQSIAPATVTLSQVQPDMEQIAFQFRQHLGNKGSWNDAITASTGQTFVELVAAGFSYDQLSIERATQETMSDTARMPLSQYTIARMFGIHLRRKTPAKVMVNLTNKDFNNIYTIPPYTQFEINQVRFFNREPIVFNRSEDNQPVVVQNVPLFQGSVETEVFVSDGRQFQTFSFGNADFSTSDYDLICFSRQGEWESTQKGLWKYSSQHQVFYENTLPDGRVEVIFGNGIYGKIPEVNSELSFTYVVTTGAAGNSSISASPQRVSIIDYQSITGLTTSSTTGGDDQHDPELYRIMGPHMYRAKDRAVTREDHEAVAFDFPGVIDIIFQGQAETNPSLKEWMNIVEIIAVTQEIWDQNRWNEFFAFLNTKSIYRLEYVVSQPVVFNTAVKADIYCDNSADLRTVYIKVQQAIERFFRPRKGMLGFSVYLSDVHACIIDSDPSINYVVLHTPEFDLPMEKNQYVKLVGTELKMFYAQRSVSPINGPNTPVIE